MSVPLVHGGDWLLKTGPMDFPEDVDVIMAVDVEPTRKELRKGTRWVYANFFEPVGTRTSNAYCLQYQDKFDLILTCDAEILSKSRKAVFMPFGMTWVPRAAWERKKDFSVSMICGGKDWMQGHKVRREVWTRQDEITVPRRFYRSTHSTPPGHAENPKVGGAPEEKAIAFDSMFHVCIENATDANYFSEKLVDCLVTRTVPIYWGCANISAFFDVAGLLRSYSAADVIRRANEVSPALYRDLLPAVERNYLRAQEFARPMADRVQEVIMRKLFGGPA
jgi:hypothetical protein